MGLSVVIIGAGLAGLTAALILQEQGVDVQVYEAKERVGGRVLTAKIDDQLVEFGGQNISDGGEAKTMRYLIDQLGLKVERQQIERLGAFFDGKELHNEEDLTADLRKNLKGLKTRLEELGQSCSNMKQVCDVLIKDNPLLYKHLEGRLRAYEGGALEELSPRYVSTLYHMIEGGLAPAHETIREDRDFIAIDMVKGGNSCLPESMARELGDRLHLESPLKKVTKKRDGKLVLSFAGGETISADKVILTIPCSTYEKVSFDEAVLPAQQLNQIKQVPYSKGGKILLTMPINKNSSPYLYAVDQMGVCFRLSGSKVVTLYLPTPFSALSLSSIYEKEKGMLEAMYGPLRKDQSSPLYSLDVPFASYIGPMGYSWANDPYARGSYSHLKAGQEEVFGKLIDCGKYKVKALFAPIDQRLYFAGEHTCIDPVIAGTMEAACESGMRIAKIILDEKR